MPDRRVLLVVAGAVVLHAAVLLPWRFAPSRAAREAVPSVSVRMVSVATVAPSVVSPAVVGGRSGESSPEAVATGSTSSEQPAPAPVDAPRGQRPPSTKPVADLATSAHALVAPSTPDRRPVGAGVSTAAAAGPAPATSPATPAPSTPALPPAPDYLSGARLDPGPRPLGEIEPVYPARAGQQQGSVVLRLLINERGGVDNVAVVRSSPAGYFEESALEAFGRASFAPGMLLGVAVKSQVTIEVEFMPINRGAAVSGRPY